ncbi:hypothetical protein AAGF08_06245 [Algoriphagus sp. SE2]|uniref:hypothetical protein n=1 Tax=Algoriphagus sp. SE2 TaxID=3141536 RepID=UPI0031CCDD12
MFSKKFTLVLAICLLVPFGLRLISSKLEPYPALLFPSGDKQVQVPLDSPVPNYRYSDLYGFTPEKGWVNIDEESFISPIPRNYLSFILENKKGLFSENSDIEVKNQPSSKPIKNFLMRNQEKKLSKDERKEIAEFFKQKLISQGFDSTRLKIVEYQVVSYPQTSKVDLSILSEEIINFDE